MNVITAAAGLFFGFMLTCALYGLCIMIFERRP